MAKRKANYDLLRIIAMLGIIMFHHFGSRTPNRFVELSSGFTNSKYFYDFINNVPGKVSSVSLLMDFCYGHLGNGGNLVFMLLTGYFLFGRKITFPKRVRSAGKVLYAILFYGIVLTLINAALLKFAYPFDCFKGYLPLFTLPNWLSGDNMWYLQAYGIFILVILPLLKLFEEKLTQTSHLCLALSLLFVHFLAYSIYLPDLWLHQRILNFILCYYIGGYFAKYPVQISLKKLIACACSYIVIYFLYEYYWRYANAVAYSPSEYSYLDVMQPFICCIIYAVLLFLIFARIEVPSWVSPKLLGRLSVSTLGIYIFHYNMISLSFILAETYWWSNWSRKGFFVFVIIDTILLFVAGTLIDLLRQWSYKHVEKRVEALFPVVSE